MFAKRNINVLPSQCFLNITTVIQEDRYRHRLCFCGFSFLHIHSHSCLKCVSCYAADMPSCLLSVKVIVMKVVKGYYYTILKQLSGAKLSIWLNAALYSLSTLFAGLSLTLDYSSTLGCCPVCLPPCLLLNLSFQKRDNSKDLSFFGINHFRLPLENSFYVYSAEVLYRLLFSWLFILRCNTHCSSVASDFMVLKSQSGHHFF